MVEINSRKFTVSVIIAVFNRPERLKRALNSLLKQTFKDFEIIVIDDGSNKHLCNILEIYYSKFASLKYVRHSNRKTPLSLNTGIRLASGKFVTFLDSDDEYKPEHLEIRIKYLKKNPDTDILHSTADIIGEEKDFYVPDMNNPGKLIHLNNCIIGATIFARKEIFEILNGFKNFYGYDFDFIRRAKRKKLKITKIDSPTYIYYRNSEDSVINKLKKDIYET